MVHSSASDSSSGAENMLKRLGITPQKINLEKLQDEYKSLLSQKETLRKNYKSLEIEIKEFQSKINNLDQYLNQAISYKQQNTLD